MASRAYASQSRATIEDGLITDYLPLVRHVVAKVAANLPQHADREDLISAGTIGLVKAARTYDPGKGAEFKTYAYIRVRGAVIDELRRRSFVPPGMQTQINAVRGAYQEFAAAHGRSPSDEELADIMHISVPQLYRVMEEARNRHFLSIHGLSDDEPALGSFLPADPAMAPDAQAEKRELSEQLAAAIEKLSEKERIVILLYYERDLTMKEAAQVLKVTESRVSQLHASALFKLSLKLRRTT